jgi:hypothetical protein
MVASFEKEQNHKVKKEEAKSPLSFKIGVETPKSQ